MASPEKINKGIEAIKEDSDDESTTTELEWLLGFVDPPRKRTDLLRHRFPSKVGGRPAWLDPVNLPSSNLLRCPVTNERMQFLLQVYAPVDTNSAAFHRMVYVFLSPDGGQLHKPGAVRAVRCQMSRNNRFYDESPPTEKDILPNSLSEEELLISLQNDPWKSLAGEAIASAALEAKQFSDSNEGKTTQFL